ncbi:sensor histidine kinase [Sporosarcina sp. FSL K6-3457]|uniref:sensor histidine kinase n=1 Tax=Sporosarcina sp. FSL K6-3457 TaxID=2978204 RepID=UPI0030FA9921
MKRDLLSTLKSILILLIIVPLLGLLLTGFSSSREQFVFIISLSLFFAIPYILITMALTRFIKIRVVKPLEKLTQVSNEILLGNLDCAIDYDRNDEIGRFAAHFEKMRLSLKENKTEQMTFEQKRKQFITNITHDLKTPLASISGHVEGLGDGMAVDEEEFQKYLNVIDKKVKELDTLIGQLKVFNESEEDQLFTKGEVIHAKDLLEELYETCGMDVALQGIPCVLINELENDCRIKVDKDHMQRVISNLVNNATRYAMNTFEMKGWNHHHTIYISVTNDGHHLKPEELPKLFDRYYSGEYRDGNPKGHLGIGLSISKNLVYLMKGDMKASIDKNIFIITIELPIYDEGI